jgi:hypothetical protein
MVASACALRTVDALASQFMHVGKDVDVQEAIGQLPRPKPDMAILAKSSHIPWFIFQLFSHRLRGRDPYEPSARRLTPAFATF